MTENEILKAAMKETGTTQIKLCDMLGYSTQSSISGVLNSTRMSVDKFVELLYMMGYEVIVCDHYNRGGSEWTVQPKGHEWPDKARVDVINAPEAKDLTPDL